MRTDTHWQPIGLKDHHGIALMLSSLRTKKSSGQGEFLDLIPFIDWCASVGLDTLQLLPLNDRNDTDNSPYNAISSCALDPIYLSLHDLPQALEISEFAPFNDLEQVDYIGLKQRKKEWLRRYFALHFDPNNAGYKNFIDENIDWLHSYALFCSNEKQENISFYYFLQFLCFEQLKKAREHATSKKVFLFGDIPILINHRSADVWAEPQFFDLSVEAGAPPDRINPGGQHWGFPLFNWNKLRENNFSWWKRRLRICKNFFHIYRIDHVVGLFRMWAFKNGAGSFIPKDPDLWPVLGLEILNMLLDSSPLLPIAEDLGGKVHGIDTLADVVRPMLKELGICGTKVIRWERQKSNKKLFIPYEKYEPLSLTTVSTHDTETIALWWKNHPQEAAEFADFKGWTYTPKLTLDQRIEVLHDSHHTPSYFHVNLLQEYLSLFSDLSWPDEEKKRMNTPGTFSTEKNWSYRFKPTVEEIIEHKGLANLFQALKK